MSDVEQLPSPTTSTGGGSPTPKVRRRRIIERPRLLRALDRSKARVRTLVGGPGYGKTILLEQWAPRDDRVPVWFRARRSAADVAVVARELVAATGNVVPGAGKRLLERLAVTDDPEREAVLLAEMLSEDLREWPDDAWIVIDDYQHLAVSPGCEAFVETIVNRTPVRLLLASRVRPAWVSGRSILYEQVLELSQGVLAMTSEEVGEVLEGSRPELTAGLLTLAEGWPAVIGLAGMTPGVAEIDADLPETLYEFFADELFRALDSTIRSGLAVLAAMPSVDAELAAVLLGDERAEQVCSECLALGILDERDGRLDLHPLAAAFLERLVVPVALPDAEAIYDGALRTFLARSDWDAVFDLSDRFGRGDDLECHLVACLDEFLHRARLATLENWVDRVVLRIGETPSVAITRAELALRQGQHLATQSLAEEALRAPRQTQWTQFRALLLAGSAAHVGSREEDAARYFELAAQAAGNESERRRALWGSLTAACALEREDSPRLLELLELGGDAPLGPSETVRAADKRIALGLRFGGVKSLAEGRRVAQLLPRVEDPFVRASFRSTFSCALNLAVEYELAAGVAAEMVSDATEFRVDFALPYGYLMEGAALAGLRRFPEAHLRLAEALIAADHCADEFARQAVYAGRIRALLHEGRVADACALEPPDVDDALPGMRGEVLLSRAFALACIGRVGEASELAKITRGTTAAIEATSLLHCIDATRSVRSRRRDVGSALEAFVNFAFSAGAVDFVVTACRACPDVLTALLRNPQTAERTGYALARAGDRLLAEGVGISLSSTVDPRALLTPREREVHALLAEGLEYADIAKQLFISYSTVKLHAHHVYKKLGYSSRTALAISAARHDAQATSAIVGPSDSTTDG